MLVRNAIVTTHYWVVEPPLDTGVYYWDCRAHNSNGWGPYSAMWRFTVTNAGVEESRNAGLGQNAGLLLTISPSVFVSSATIEYSLWRECDVILQLVNTNGTVVRRLEASRKTGGLYRLTWDGTSERGGHVAKGIYFIQLQAGGFAATHKLVKLD